MWYMVYHTERRGGMANTFGEFVRQRRAERRLSLRAFCAAAGVDPANYSKMERGKLPPPRDGAVLNRFRSALGIAAGSPEDREMVRLASLDRGELPPQILSNQELVGK